MKIEKLNGRGPANEKVRFSHLVTVIRKLNEVIDAVNNIVKEKEDKLDSMYHSNEISQGDIGSTERN